jgi:hypothetical protein
MKERNSNIISTSEKSLLTILSAWNDELMKGDERRQRTYINSYKLIEIFDLSNDKFEGPEKM